MRYKVLLFSLFTFIGFSGISQNIDLEKLLTKEVSTPDCRTISANVDKNIERLYKSDSIPELIEFWKDACGETEPILRLTIINQILNGINLDSLIAVYFENYAYAFNIRVINSSEPDYISIYEENQHYYNYITLNGNFDKLIIKLANSILEKAEISKDEKLICFLFSFQQEKFYQSLKKKEYSEARISQINKERLAEYRGPFTYKVSIGSWMPINDPNNTFGINPQLGIGFGFETTKFRFDVSIDFRINVNDNDFSIKAHSDTINTHSDVGFLVGANVLYKAYEKNSWKIYSGFGAGWDIIDTNVKKPESNDEEDIYYDIAAINLNFGVALMRDVFLNNEIGLGINYHYVPYHMDSNYYTHFSSDYLTLNLIYKF